MDSALQPLRIAIVGVGPRGVIAYGAIGHHLRGLGSEHPVRVHLIDPGEIGVGCHPVDQPEHLLVNTLACQLTMFERVGEGAQDEDPASGPTLTAWARGRGYRRVGDVVRLAPEGEGAALSDGDFLPRAVLGRYLRWTYERHRAWAPANLETLEHRAAAVAIDALGDGEFSVRLEDGGTVDADVVFLCTGHSSNRPGPHEQALQAFCARHAGRARAPAYIRNIYPVTSLEGIEPGSAVAIDGMGLTASDAIATLTEARGGRFIRDGERLAYAPCGREPRIFLFSRQCLPPRARPVNEKGLFGRHALKFLTCEAVEAARAAASDGQVDLERDLLPLLRLEMAYAARIARAGPIEAEDFRPGPEEAEVLALLLDAPGGRVFPAFADYRAFFLDEIRSDLVEAARGNRTSPIKAAADVIRDARDPLCLAAEFNGLSAASHAWYVRTFTPLANRITFGPPIHRNQQLLALAEAGVLDLGGGPGCEVVCDDARGEFRLRTSFGEGAHEVAVQSLIVGRLDNFLPLEDSAPLTRDLLDKGLVRPLMNGGFHPGGYDIDPSNRPRARGGGVTAGLWIFGHPVEGAKFRSHPIPRTATPSGSFEDVQDAVRAAFAHHGRSGGRAIARLAAAGG